MRSLESSQSNSGPE